MVNSNWHLHQKSFMISAHVKKIIVEILILRRDGVKTNPSLELLNKYIIPL